MDAITIPANRKILVEISEGMFRDISLYSDPFGSQRTAG